MKYCLTYLALEKSTLAATVAPTLISSATASLAVASCISYLSSYVVFKHSKQQLLPAFVTTEQ